VCYNSSLREHVIVDDLEVNDNGEWFHNFFNTQKLSVLNTWFSHRRCRRITRHSPDGVTKKIYDFILSCSWIRQYVKTAGYTIVWIWQWPPTSSSGFTNTASTKAKAWFRKRSKKPQSIKLDFHTFENENIRTAFKDERLNNIAAIDTEQEVK